MTTGGLDSTVEPDAESADGTPDSTEGGSAILSEPAEIASIRREELARYLRTQRSRIKPEDVGLPRQARRRVPGLRRYEVAQLSGVSDTWYTWLEQARLIKVSAEALDSVARALRLDEHGRRHIRRLAGIPVVDPEPPPNPHWRPEYDTLLEQLLPWPASIITAALDIVAWNRAYATIFGDPSKMPESKRNALWRMFTDPDVRKRADDWEGEARAVVARFQFESGNYPDDPRFGELVRDLSETSQEFSEYWNSGEIRPFTVKSVFVINHPGVGELKLHKLQMRMLDRPRLVVTVHQATDLETRLQLEKLLDDDPGEPDGQQDSD